MQHLKRFLFLIATYSAKSKTFYFFYLQCLGVLHIVDENKWHIWNLEEILSQKYVLFMQKYWFQNLTFLSNLDLISVKNKLWWIHRVKCPSLLISRCKMTQKTYVARHACDLYFVVSLCDLILTFSGMTFVLTHYHSQTFTSTLCEFELFAARLTDPRVQNVKVFFSLWPYLGLTHDLYLKMLNNH